MKSNKIYNSLFSHIYIEEEILNHKETQKILSRNKWQNIIKIENYKDIFNRPHQNYARQKESLKLIIAKKYEPFIYKGSYFSDAFEFDEFYYSPSIKNCIYDCDYCYIQGLYPSAYLVIFVNLEDYFSELERDFLQKPTLIAPSYDTDLLALEGVISQVEKWINFSYSQKNLHLEIRTKSGNFSKIEHLNPTKNITLTWSLSPQEVIAKHEKFTANLEKRVSAINSAIAKNWKVRLAIDPILDLNYSNIKESQEIYINFLKYLIKKIEFKKIDSLTFGTFRISSQHLNKLKKLQKSEIAFYPYETVNNISFYKRERDLELINPLLELSKKHIPENKIRVWKE